jgi:hypothetical protein
MEAFENGRQHHCNRGEFMSYLVNPTAARRRARLKREALAIASRAGYALAMGATALIIWFFIVVFFQLGA